VIQTRNLDEAVAIVNQIAPEHVQIMVKRPLALLRKIRHAGAVFIGPYTPTAVGDYVAGPSHVLPTGGTARFFSGLGVEDFLKRVHVIGYSRKALELSREMIERIGTIEGMTHHVESVRVRFSEK
jgi:histidinol dehydrogenase